MTPYLTLPSIGGGLLLLGFALLWLWQERHRDAGIVDVGWAAGLALLALLYALGGEGHPLRRLLVAVMGGLWGGRLALHLLFDRVLGKSEDGRYQTLRQEWGERAPAAFFLFFQAQAALDLLLSLPFLLAAMNPAPAQNAFDAAAVALWCVAVGGESLADRQLARWRADPANRGRTCRVGLWRFSRHPNYFFEWLTWCAFALLAWSAPLGWIGLTAPLLLLLFLFRITGIPATEAQALRSRGDDYRRYQAETSVFIPWFPRQGGR